MTRNARPVAALAVALALASCSSTAELVAGETPEPSIVASSEPSTTATQGASTSIATTAPPSTTTPDTTRPLPPGLHPLLPDHNVLDEQRINIVFAAFNMPDDVDWVDYARTLLTWDGPIPMNRFDGVAVEPEQANGLAFGLFSIEPFLSHRDSFNVWYFDAEAPGIWGWTDSELPLPVELRDSIEIILGHELDTPPQARFPDFVPPAVPVPGAVRFGPVSMSITDPILPLFDTTTLAHEMGHAVFGFGDKYLFDSYGADPWWLGRSIYPSCAASQEQAEQFFGDLVGVVAPAFDEVFLDAYDHYGIELEPGEVDRMREELRIDYVPNGCFGPEGVSIKSTSGGLMNGWGATPVMGEANHRYAASVLSEWE